MKNYIILQKISLLAIIFGGFLVTDATFSANYEVTAPILLDAQKIPYQQVAQRGQTILGDGGVGWSSYYYIGATDVHPDGTRPFDVPGMDKENNIILTSINPSYVCVSPRKDGKSISQYTYIYPYQRQAPTGGPNALLKRSLWQGNIGNDSGFMRLFTQYNRKDTTLLDFFCGDNINLYLLGFPVRNDDTLTYRIQYPVGTPISVKAYSIRKKKDLTIISNYATSDTSGTGILQVQSSIDPCYGDSSVCTSDTITATSLSGKTLDLKKTWADFMNANPSSEYFPIPADTATIVFHIAKK